MNFPSIKTLSLLGLTKEQTKELRKRIENGRGLNYFAKLKNTTIEQICLPEGCLENCQSPELTISYVNLGDTYSTTLMRVNTRYKVGSWGDIVEKFGK